tara:strand:- start:632 stop:862 length:231 start_codon:yes stop_codon:yes gene_type:complete
MSNQIHNFRYFIVGNVPVKLALSEKGGVMGTLGPDIKSGTFQVEMKYFRDVMDGDDANEVDMEHFDKVCLEYFETT